MEIFADCIPQVCEVCGGPCPMRIDNHGVNHSIGLIEYEDGKNGKLYVFCSKDHMRLWERTNPIEEIPTPNPKWTTSPMFID